ncbi:hypothetical protein YSY43_49730 [Paenibacillus sp. YSY-4.3]
MPPGRKRLRKKAALFADAKKAAPAPAGTACGYAAAVTQQKAPRPERGALTRCMPLQRTTLAVLHPFRRGYADQLQHIGQHGPHAAEQR